MESLRDLVPSILTLDVLFLAGDKGSEGHDALLHKKRFSLFYLRAMLVATRVCG